MSIAGGQFVSQLGRNLYRMNNAGNKYLMGKIDILS